MKRQIPGAPIAVENDDDQIEKLVKESLTSLSAQQDGASVRLAFLLRFLFQFQTE